jgi:glutathione-specific gamma-glutamylcyclotransferase
MATRLTDQQLRASLAATLGDWDGRSDLFTFAYGSLIWKPEPGMVDPKKVRLFGYHRAFCLWSRINRGTPETPGLVLALAPGGSCTGVLYRIPANHAEGLLARMWQREMAMGSYVPRWVRVQGDVAVGAARNLPTRLPMPMPIPMPMALAFTINSAASGYAGALSLDEQALHIARGCGRYGHACDYLFETEAALKSWGIRDIALSRLATRVRERQQLRR